MTIQTISLVLELENAEGIGEFHLVEQTVNSLGRSVRNAPPSSQRMLREVVAVTSGGSTPIWSDSLQRILDVEFPGKKIILCEPRNIGYFEKKMLGAIAASSSHVVFVDSDVLYAEDWYQTVSFDLVEKKSRVLYGRTFAEPGTEIQNTFGLLWQFDYLSCEGNHGGRSPQRWANNWAVERSLLVEFPLPRVGGELKVERVLWEREITKAGVAVDQSLAWGTHRQPDSFREWASVCWRSGMSRAFQRKLNRKKNEVSHANPQTSRPRFDSVSRVVHHLLSCQKVIPVKPVFSIALLPVKRMLFLLGYAKEFLFTTRSVSFNNRAVS